MQNGVRFGRRWPNREDVQRQHQHDLKVGAMKNKLWLLVLANLLTLGADTRFWACFGWSLLAGR